MNISLKQWKEVHDAVTALKRTLETTESVIFTIASRFPTGSPEFNLLFRLSNEIHQVRQDAPAAYPFCPQSEWMGGDSDDPKNHKLREPNCCPLPHRKFTPEEIKEAGAVCHGPVQWEYHPPTETTGGVPDGSSPQS